MTLILGPVSRKSRELSGPEKPFVKLLPAYSVKLIFSHVVKGIKIKITAKFRASRRLRFEDTKRIMSPEIRPKSFGTFEKQAPGLRDNPNTNADPKVKNRWFTLKLSRPLSDVKLSLHLLVCISWRKCKSKHKWPFLTLGLVFVLVSYFRLGPLYCLFEEYNLDLTIMDTTKKLEIKVIKIILTRNPI